MSDTYVPKFANASEVYAQIDKMLKKPVAFLPENYLNEVLAHFESKCGRSKALYEEAKDYIPGGVQHNLAFNYPFPICMDKAEGAYLYDADGNKYIDFLQSGGPVILGNNYENVRKEVISLIESCGPVTGLFHEAELRLAKEINRHFPSCEMFRMFNSGSESVQAAVRLARHFTGHKHAIKIGGGYHGWFDQFVYGMRLPGTGRFEAHGIPKEYSSFTHEVLPNDPESLRACLKRNRIRGGTACVVLEPLGPESGTRPVDADYNANVRKLCDEFGALLVFDEVVTAFRIGLSGAQGYYNVTPDITVFGKIIGGGYPSAGGVGARKEIMRLMAAGIETGEKKIFVAGTLAGNPLTAAAGAAAIREIERTDACAKASKAGDRLTKGLNFLKDRYGLPFVIYNQGSICHIEVSGAMMVNIRGLAILTAMPKLNERKKAMQQMGAAYMASGIVTLAGSRAYTSLADTDAVIDDALDRFESIYKRLND